MWSYFWLHRKVFLLFRNVFWGDLRVMWASQVVQLVNNLFTMQETWIWSWVQKSPWQLRGWLPTSVFLPHGQRSLAGYSPWGPKSQTRLSDYTTTTGGNVMMSLTYSLQMTYGRTLCMKQTMTCRSLTKSCTQILIPLTHHIYHRLASNV